MYDYLLFDLDGTLTDPGIGITNSVIYALKKWGIEESDRKKLYPFIGPPLSESFSKYYGFSKEDSLRCVDYYREYFKDKGLFENTVYEGVADLLQELRKSGKRIILATSKPEIFAKRILEHFDLIKYFDFVAGASLDESRNKKSDVIRYAMDSFGITDKSRVVMIGDREQDVSGAKTCGIDSIGVLYGYGDMKELTDANATYIAEKVSDILKFI